MLSRRITTITSSTTSRLIISSSSASSLASGLFRHSPLWRNSTDSSSSSSTTGEDASSQQQQSQQRERVVLPSWTDPHSKDLYTRLGLRRGATEHDIKKHWRALSKTYHPDLTTLDKAEAEEKFRQVKEAYETLASPQRKKVYDDHGYGASEQEQFERAHTGGTPFWQSSAQGRYGKAYSFDGKRVHVGNVPMSLWFITAFSFAVFFNAFQDVRKRKADQKKQKELQAQLVGTEEGSMIATNSSYAQMSSQRSSLWRPFIGTMLIISLLPRLPATIFVWYFYMYRPTIDAEDRTALDNVTIIARDEMEGKAMKLQVSSPYLDQLSRNAVSAGGKMQDHILVTVVRANPQTVATASAGGTGGSGGGPPQFQQVQHIDPLLQNTIEYPNGNVNLWSMSVPRPHGVQNIVTADGKSVQAVVPLPATVTMRVKTAVRENGKIDANKGEVVFEKAFNI